MNLSQLKAYLSQHKRASLPDLANHFQSDPETVKAMLQHWQHKGKVQHIHVKSCQKGCCSGGKNIDVYEWI